MPRKYKKVRRFSEQFGIAKSQHELDFIDIPVNGDIPLFIDPYPIQFRIDEWSNKCHRTIADFFQRVIDAIKKGDDDRAHDLLEHLREPNQTHLGLSKGKVARGRGIGSDQAGDLLEALRKSNAVKTGFLQDLEDCALLIDNIGPDKISDITTNVIRAHLIAYTLDQCTYWNLGPFPDVFAGYVWTSGGSAGWQSVYAPIPTHNGSTILLVPKAIARFSPSLKPEEYYRRGILEYLQQEHLNSNSNLVRLLKSKEVRPPFKTTLEKIHPFSKEFLYDFSRENPKVFKTYKQQRIDGSSEVSDAGLEEVLGAEPFDVEKLEALLSAIKTGKESADEYENAVLGILEAIFYPSLIYPTKQQKIDEGRKRVDVTFTNAAKDGFFHRLHDISKISCSYIFFECKNYSNEVANPELDQLTGRFSINRGRFGVIVCRKFEDKELFYKRCRDVALAQQGFPIALDDGDLSSLLALKRVGDSAGIDAFLDGCMKKIVM